MNIFPTYHEPNIYAFWIAYLCDLPKFSYLYILFIYLCPLALISIICAISPVWSTFNSFDFAFLFLVKVHSNVLKLTKTSSILKLQSFFFYCIFIFKLSLLFTPNFLDHLVIYFGFDRSWWRQGVYFPNSLATAPAPLHQLILLPTYLRNLHIERLIPILLSIFMPESQISL